MTLDLYICKLLQRNDCVIVPGFGGFVGNYHCAEFHQTNSLIYPPYTSVLFNPRLTTNDGLLCASICESEVLSLSESLDWIEKSVKVWKEKLQCEARVKLGEIGFLFTENGQIAFEQNRETNLLLSSYGLNPIRFVQSLDVAKNEKSLANALEIVEINKSVNETDEMIFKDRSVKKQKASVRSTTSDGKNAKTQSDSRRNHRSLKWIAAAVFLPVAFYSYWLPVQTDVLDTRRIQLSDFNPFNSQALEEYHIRENEYDPETIAQNDPTWEELTGSLGDYVAVYSLEISDELYIPIRIGSIEISESTLQSGSPVQVIAGCFSILNNAEGLVEDLKSQGFNAGIYDRSGGLHRVSAGGCSSVEEAQGIQNQLTSKGHSSWLLMK